MQFSVTFITALLALGSTVVAYPEQKFVRRTIIREVVLSQPRREWQVADDANRHPLILAAYRSATATQRNKP